MLNSSAVASSTAVYPATALPYVINQLESGHATFQATDDDIGWRVHFSNRHLHFVTAIAGQPLRLQYWLPRFLPNVDRVQYPTELFQQDYLFLCQLWHSGRISAHDLRQLLSRFTQEALIHLLTMRRAKLTIESSLGLDPILISVPLQRAIESTQDSVHVWSQFVSQEGDVCSPLQRLEILHLDHVLDYWQQECSQGNLPDVLSDRWQLLVTENWVLYAAAQLLQIDISTFVRHLQPLADRGAVKIIPFRQVSTTSIDNRPLIACIDDSKTMRAIIRSILEPAGYQVLEILSASQATSILAEVQPAVILMDISMPEMDGYELCGLLKRSATLKTIPVVMLTGRDGVVDRVRARFVGATDYITKPFDPDQLIHLVHQLVLEA